MYHFFFILQGEVVGVVKHLPRVYVLYEYVLNRRSLHARTTSAQIHWALNYLCFPFVLSHGPSPNCIDHMKNIGFSQKRIYSPWKGFFKAYPIHFRLCYAQNPYHMYEKSSSSSYLIESNLQPQINFRKWISIPPFNLLFL